MADELAPRLFRFGVFAVDVQTGELRKNGVKVRLQEKPFQLLVLLLERQGELVSRDQLREALWSADTFVDFDHSLGTAIAKLRTALGDSAKSPRFVETVASRGYRFIAPLVPVPDNRPRQPDPDPPAPRHGNRLLWLLATIVGGFAVGGLLLAAILGFDVGGARAWLRRQSNQPVHSLVVLPLRGLGSDTSQEYLVDGMTEELTTMLAQLDGIRVLSRSSAMRYRGTTKSLPQIARELNVDGVVEGTVLRAGSRVRISAQLIDARTDEHLWANSYERDLGDAMQLQVDIARAIAREVRVRLTPRDQATFAAVRGSNAVAHEAYLRGRYHLNKGDEGELHRSIDAFNEALAADPEDARSQAGLAAAYVSLTDYYGSPAEMMPRAKLAAEQAVKLDPGLADGHVWLGAVRFLYDWNWSGADAELSRAVELDPSSADAHLWYGVFLEQMGQSEKAVAEVTRASTLDPLSIAVRINAGWVFYLARQNDQALSEFRKALELEPNLGTIHTSIWLAYLGTGAGSSAFKIADVGSSPMDLATAAGIRATEGHRAEAELLLMKLSDLSATRYVCPYEIATVHNALGHRDDAIKWLRRGVESRSVCMPDLKTDPRWDNLRTDARFQQILHEVGF